MSEVKQNVAVEAKKARRGVSNETKAVRNLTFTERDAAQNGLFRGHLHDVALDWSTGGDNTAFAGVKVPRVTLHFASDHTDAAQQRHVFYTLFAVESNVETIPGGKNSWMVDNLFNWIKHLLDTFVLKGRDMTDAEVDALQLGFDDTDDDGNFVSLDIEEIVNGYATMFSNFVAMMNGSWNIGEGDTPKPVYKTADNKYIPLWIKLLRHKRTKSGWTNVGQNGELAFDRFIGSGVIEIAKGQNPPAILRVDLSKESITPKEIKKAPTISGQGMPGMPMGGVMPGMPGMDMNGFGGANDAFNAAGISDDGPF